MGKNETWREHLKNQGSSGQSGAAYCRERGTSEKTFHYWRSKLKAERGGRFVQVGGVEPLRIVRSALTIKVPADAGAVILRTVIEALDASD